MARKKRIAQKFNDLPNKSGKMHGYWAKPISRFGQPKKLNVIRGRNEAKKELRQPFNRPFEWHFGLCLQQKWHKGGGVGRKIDQKVNKSPTNLKPQRTQRHTKDFTAESVEDAEQKEIAQEWLECDQP